MKAKGSPGAPRGQREQHGARGQDARQQEGQNAATGLRGRLEAANGESFREEEATGDLQKRLQSVRTRHGGLREKKQLGGSLLPNARRRHGQSRGAGLAPQCTAATPPSAPIAPLHGPMPRDTPGERHALTPSSPLNDCGHHFAPREALGVPARLGERVCANGSRGPPDPRAGVPGRRLSGATASSLGFARLAFFSTLIRRF